MKQVDVVIIGAGAAGLMCAASAAKRGRRVLLLDKGKKPGRKILISGGGRCNFTNYDVSAAHFVCQNPHFVKSALAQYSQWDFFALVNQHGIEWEEREHGQFFCLNSAKDIVTMLLKEADVPNLTQCYNAHIEQIEKTENGFLLICNQEIIQSSSLVIATGGLSMPKLGASPFGYQIAEQFGLKRVPTSAGLVPFTLHDKDKAAFAALSGIAFLVTASTESGIQFKENLLFTHRGLSGPVILQVSSYWKAGEAITINLLPDLDLFEYLQTQRENHPEQSMKNALARLLPKRFVEVLISKNDIQDKPLKQFSQKEFEQITEFLSAWKIAPNGTEGYRTAEVTLGGVDTDELSSKTMEAKKVKGLYFIGEVMDVSGWLGGYNFQWAWSSGWVAGQDC
jgi:predicted Rossmann fold flavoprotein